MAKDFDAAVELITSRIQMLNLPAKIDAIQEQLDLLDWATAFFETNKAVTIVKQDRDLPCAYPGQTGRVFDIQEDGVYTALKCGHIYFIEFSKFKHKLGIVPKESMRNERGQNGASAKQHCSEGLQPSEVKDEDMATKKKPSQTVIPDGTGKLLVTNLESDVLEFCASYDYQKILNSQISEGKVFFRQAAEQAMEKADGNVRSISFVGKKRTITVSQPDPEKEGNRTNVNGSTIEKALELGVNIHELEVLETKKTYVLSGSYADWFEQWLTQNFLQQGKDIPDEIEKKEVLKLSTEGYFKLKDMKENAKTPNEKAAAEFIIKSCLKDPTVNVD